MAAVKHQTIPILTYHSIEDSGSVISVSPLQFEKQIRFLKKSGYKSLPIGEIVKFIKNEVVLPNKAIVITFDDGYRNNFTHAFPIMDACGFTATIFLTTGHCGNSNNWPNQDASIPSLPMLNWEEVAEMSRYGYEFGAHTRSHPRLVHLNGNRAAREILESKADIEANICKPVKFFSYPFGGFNDRVRDIVRSSFNGAISNKLGKVNCQSDIYALERINATSQIFKSLPINISVFRSFDFYIMMKRSIDKIRKKI